MRPTPETNHALLKSHGAQIEALRLVVIALAMQSDRQKLLRDYDAACEALTAHRQATAKPDDYLETLDVQLAQLRAALAQGV